MGGTWWYGNEILRMADYEELVMLTMVEICGNVDDECRVGC
jgi:hypothetical protein